ncbi:MAG: UPF0261 family protein [Deltaproteobacteria bacterium CG_4_9_14_3_um_filter_51_14]|nr:MAG: UPF0261 family protein [Deltaproteobacteria bacterium CG_4_9_14_3_um_filter_51_14]
MSDQALKVLVVSTLDTKARETVYLKEKAASLGLEAILMDLSMRGGAQVKAQITPAEVAAETGSSIDEIRSSRERSKSTSAFIEGGSAIALRLWREGKLHGIMGVGGATGSLMATEIMRALPFGIPKIMISSAAALPGLSTRFIGTGDIMLFHTVIELSGLSNLLRNVLDRAACAMAGMLKGETTVPKASAGKAIALTMLGPCDSCGHRVQQALEDRGYQVIGFHAAGVCDRAMEEMIEEGFFEGVVDLAPGGVGENLFGFMRDAGPKRMEAAGKVGIPQVISTCSVNHITPSRSTYTSEMAGRRKYDLDRLRTWLRISPAELRQVARVFIEKLNRARGPVKIVIPGRGWSSVDVPGNPTFDPLEDMIFVEELKAGLEKNILVSVVDANMEEPAFADAVVDSCLSIFPKA